MEKILTPILAFFFEENPLISIFSLILASCSLLLIYSDWPIEKKLGLTLLSFFSCFIIIKILSLIYNAVKTFLLIIYYKLKKHYSYQQYLKEKEKDKNREMNEKLETLWSIVDNCSKEEQQLLMEFIKNKNKPIIKEDTYNNKILNSNLVHKTIHKPQEIYTEYTKPKSPYAIGISRTVCTRPEYKYILKEEVYELLKESWERYGRISHFKEDEEGES